MPTHARKMPIRTSPTRRRLRPRSSSRVVVGSDAVAYRAMIVTRAPAMMSVRLKASADASSLMPRALRFSFHHCGSLALSIAASAPTTRNAASTSESSIGVRCTDDRNVT